MKRIKAILLAMAMVVTLGTVALAHDHDSDDNRAWGRDRNADAREYGYHNGYRFGWSHGRQDRYQRLDYSYNDGSYRRADLGYDYSMGPRGQYKQGFRQGYREGYDDAYYQRGAQYRWFWGQNGNRTPWDPDGDGDVDRDYRRGGDYGNYDNSVNYGNGSASQWGYRDGLQAGQRDRSSGHSFRPTQWEAYKDADHGMSSSTGYGSSGQYKQEYRQAFMNGYQQGYGRR